MKTLTNITVASFAALTLILTGCAKEEQSGDGNQTATAKILGVNAFVSEDATTRAVVTGTSLTSGTFFGLYGYKGTTLYTDEETEGTGRPVDNVQVNNSGVIQGLPIYWPTSNFSATADNIKFFAYYPYQGSFGANITTLTPSSTGLTIGWTTPAAADVDLMYASSDPYPNVPQTTPTKGVASLRFNHILSHFDVQAKLVDNTAATNAPTLTVKSVSVKHNVTGTYTGATGLWNTSSEQLRTITKNIGLSKTEFKSVADFIVLPQTSTTREVVVTYDFGTTTNQTLTIPNANIPVFTIANKNTLQITFTVTDTAVKISFGVSVTPWGAGTTKNVNEDLEV